MLPPASASKTIEDYARNIFIAYVVSQVRTVKRLDVIWDIYYPSTTWTLAELSSKGWYQSELFELLAKHVESLAIEGKQLIITFNEDVISATAIHKEGLATCNHEEGDTSVLLHADKLGYHRAIIRTVDTDIVVLCIFYITKWNFQELWIAFGVGKHVIKVYYHI